MTLKEWREKNNYSQEDIAHLLRKMLNKSLTQRAVCTWEHGGMPRRVWREAILSMTQGKVTPSDF